MATCFSFFFLLSFFSTRSLFSGLCFSFLSLRSFLSFFSLRYLRSGLSFFAFSGFYYDWSSTTEILPSVSSFRGVFFERDLCLVGFAGFSSLESRESWTTLTLAFFFFFLPALRGFSVTFGASIELSFSPEVVFFFLDETLEAEGCLDIERDLIDCFDLL